MILLDTDHMSLLEWGGADSSRLRERLADVDEHEVFTSIVSYEEQMRGWMAYIARAKSIATQVEGYQRLRRHLANYCQVPIADFTEEAAEKFQDLKTRRIRVGTMDLKIAAIALSHDALLLTRNTVDFAKVAGLRIADWSS